MEILHLRYFVAVAEELNFTRAADRLHMATSPLSQRIKDLERELRAPLFVRGHHKIELTPAGEALLPTARDVLARFDAVPRVVREHAERESRVAVVGIAPDVSGDLRSRFLAAVAAKHPDIEVRLRPASTEPLVTSLLADEIDFALVHGPVTGRGIDCVKLETNPVGAVVGAGSGFDDRTSVRLEELAHLPFASIGYDAAPEIYRRTDEMLTRFGVRKRMIVEGHNFGGLAHVVAAGQAFTFIGLETGTTSRMFAGEPVVVLEIEGTHLKITTVAAWRLDRAETEGVVADLAETVSGAFLPAE